MDKAKINSPLVRIITSALLFGFLHVIYLDWITFVFGIVSGLIWGFIYEKTRNFWGVSLSHIIFGGVTILAGLI